MDKQEKDLTVDETRRKFLEKAGKVSIAAPAAAILLSGGIPTVAQASYGGGGTACDPYKIYPVGHNCHVPD